MTVVSSTPVDARADTRLIELALPSQARPLEEAKVPDNALSVQALYVKQPELMIQRPYTPLDPIVSHGADGRVRLLVKRYAEGEVSRFLHRLRTGDTVDVRGPVTTWLSRPGSVERVTFIAGGTGIAPLIQLRSALSHVPEVRVFAGMQSTDTVFCAKELAEISQIPGTDVTVAVGDGGRAPLPLTTAPLRGTPSARALGDWLGSPPEGSHIVLVSGPDAYVNPPVLTASLVDIIAGRRPRARTGRAGGVAGMKGYAAHIVTAL